MSTDILAEILSLRDAASRYPDRNAVVSCRVSSRGQRANGSLATQVDTTQSEVRSILGPGKLKRIVAGVELGQIDGKRPKLSEAIASAKKFNAMLVARDLSRFVRSANYNRRTNINAEPTIEELERLFDMADGVPLVTLEHPALTESERHSRAVRRSERSENRSVLSGPAVIFQVLTDLEMYSLGDVAKRYGVSKSAIQRIWDLWKHETFPGDAYATAFSRGELSVDGRRKIVSGD